MSQDWTEGFCNETTGFLFRHDCQQLASWRCKRCGKPVCDEHAKQVPAEAGAGPGETVTVCKSCARTAGTQAGSGRSHDMYDDDYYYHSRMYYPGYGTHAWASHPQRGPGHDPNDLTPADAESLSAEGDWDYEADMGAS